MAKLIEKITNQPKSFNIPLRSSDWESQKDLGLGWSLFPIMNTSLF